MAKVAPSILSADFLHLGQEISFLNAHADLIHLDVMDGTFVPNLSFGFPVIEAVSKTAELPLDIHLMIVNPDKYFERFVKAGASMISFHLEAAEDAGKDAAEWLRLIRSMGVRAGLAIDPDVPVEKLFPYIEEVDFFVIMSVFAGFGGQKFIEATLDRVAALRKAIDEQGISKDIEVDGGVSASNAGKLSKAGATILVAGNSVFRSDNRAQVIDEIRKAEE